ncbi:hypothetical protein DFH09DRAFT_197269 [Mycena vulgaris]|nr:hypothetical protein DFH09DRAFT_197269 [Mycena vulgaris]
MNVHILLFFLFFSSLVPQIAHPRDLAGLSWSPPVLGLPHYATWGAPAVSCAVDIILTIRYTVSPRPRLPSCSYKQRPSNWTLSGPLGTSPLPLASPLHILPVSRARYNLPAYSVPLPSTRFILIIGIVVLLIFALWVSPPLRRFLCAALSWPGPEQASLADETSSLATAPPALATPRGVFKALTSAILGALLVLVTLDIPSSVELPPSPGRAHPVAALQPQPPLPDASGQPDTSNTDAEGARTRREHLQSVFERRNDASKDRLAAEHNLNLAKQRLEDVQRMALDDARRFASVAQGEDFPENENVRIARAISERECFLSHSAMLVAEERVANARRRDAEAAKELLATKAKVEAFAIHHIDAAKTEVQAAEREHELARDAESATVTSGRVPRPLQSSTRANVGGPAITRHRNGGKEVVQE